MITDRDFARLNAEQGSSSVSNEETRRRRVRALNDQLRQHSRGGVWQVTRGIADLPPEKVKAILAAVASFSAFTPDNDPWGEHDCAVLDVHGEKIIWKIDYYDRSRRYHSPDPANSKVTIRVLTVMLSHEY